MPCTWCCFSVIARVENSREKYGAYIQKREFSAFPEMPPTDLTKRQATMRGATAKVSSVGAEDEKVEMHEIVKSRKLGPGSSILPSRESSPESVRSIERALFVLFSNGETFCRVPETRRLLRNGYTGRREEKRFALYCFMR